MLEDSPRIGRRSLIKRGAAVGAVAWTAPVLTSRGASAATGSPPPTTTIPAEVTTALEVDKSAPATVFPGQRFAFVVTVRNVGTDTARDVVVRDRLPAGGAFVSSSPTGSVASGVLRVALGDLDPGEQRTVRVRWKAPTAPTTLENSATVRAANAVAASGTVSVPVGATMTMTGAGAVAAGTGLRLQPSGTITVAGIPAGATIERAVLVWGVTVGRAGSNIDPAPDTLEVNGELVTADFKTGQADLCITGDENEDITIGYAADIGAIVDGNGSYTLTDYPNVNSFPFTEGASLVVFFTAPGVDNQVFADFTMTGDAGHFTGPMTRSFTGIASVGSAATLVLAGPGGDAIPGEDVTITGASTIAFDSTWDRSSGAAWDNDSFDVSPVLPAGQSSLAVEVSSDNDCIGLSAAVLVVAQA